ncbi:MAG: polysaccharide deacetylase family protein [Chloroflexi bacterium]|nr:polysaccharide deacetylase family protein [Chloroflexota bacterium]
MWPDLADWRLAQLPGCVLLLVLALSACADARAAPARMPTATALPTATPSPSPTATPPATPSPTATPTPSPTPPPTLSPTPSPTSSSTATATATDTPSPTPTAAPLSARPSTRGSGREVVVGPAEGNRVAFTFDAGSGARWTPPILAALKDAGIQMTFFVTGRWAEANPDLLRQIVADGHELGNHTYSHPDLVGLIDEEATEEIERTETIVRELTGKSTRPYFRFPFGSRDGRTLDLANRLGYISVFWTLDSADWRPALSPATVRDRVIRETTAGAIVVFHADSEQTARVLPEILRGVRARGLEITSLSSLLRSAE